MAVPLAARRPGLERAEARAPAWTRQAVAGSGSPRSRSAKGAMPSTWSSASGPTEEGHAPAGHRPHVSGSRPVCGKAEPQRCAPLGRQRFSKAWVPRRGKPERKPRPLTSLPRGTETLLFYGASYFLWRVLCFEDAWLCVWSPNFPYFLFWKETNLSLTFKKPRLSVLCLLTRQIKMKREEFFEKCFLGDDYYGLSVILK